MGILKGDIMQDSIISWTDVTWNPVHGCSVVSEGCRFCYAETISRRYNMTRKPWTGANAADNVMLKPHKLGEPLKLKGRKRVFVNSMSDCFHEHVPDTYIAQIFRIMHQCPQHVFQVLTKRPQRAADWADAWQRVREAGDPEDPWTPNIWMGTSVEDARVLNRVDHLRRCGAKVRFISAEPLLGPLTGLNLTGIHWVIVGGESGSHMTDDSPRWMQQAWAREIRDVCVASGVAYFYKQDSAKRTEVRPWLVEEDGSRWTWQQSPGDLRAPVNVDTGEVWAVEQPATRLVNIRDLPAGWRDDAAYVYIGRANTHHNLPASPWANPFKLAVDTPKARADAIDRYREYIAGQIDAGAVNLDDLRGKTLVCWCAPAACHGDVLLELLGETVEQPATNPQQSSLFDLDSLNQSDVHYYDS